MVYWKPNHPEFYSSHLILKTLNISLRDKENIIYIMFVAWLVQSVKVLEMDFHYSLLYDKKIMKGSLDNNKLT